MKIAVIIPCWIEDLDKLALLFDSIEKQTRRPDLVFLRVSSIPKEYTLEIPKITFPLIVDTIEKQQSAAENRNHGILNVSDEYDILSFFDSDDLMHPQRLEYLEKAFIESKYDAILHDYIAEELENFEGWPDIEYKLEKYDNHSKTANGHISIRNNVKQNILFPTDKLTIGKGDTVFIKGIIELNYTIGFINGRLSFYRHYSPEKRFEKDYILFQMRGFVM